MSVQIEVLSPEEAVSPADRDIADMIGLDGADLERLLETRVHYLGNIVLLGEGTEHPALRTHCGPSELIKRGGTKYKFYSLPETWRRDGIDHGQAMFFKIGCIDETEYGGGKTVANINPRALEHEQLTDALDQTAGLIQEAGLADPTRDGTAGDEGTNGEIGKAYLNGLRRRGVPHAEACVTGKPDMKPRAAATGRGAAIVHRTHMRRYGEQRANLVIQGAGFAGAYNAAEAYDPLFDEDRDITIAPVAIGDIDPSTGRAATLVTDHPDGLPVTRQMVDALLDPTDRHIRYTKGNKLAALAWKLEQAGAEVDIVDRDVLTYEPQTDDKHYLAPAATSNVITPDNIEKLKINDLVIIGNHVIRADAIKAAGQLGFRAIPGELANAGGVKMSIMENRRDLDRIAAAENGGLYLPVDDATYERELHTAMVDATNRAYNVAGEYEVDLDTAVKAVALGNYALAFDMPINDAMRKLLKV